jgi:hypothetical protein
MVLKKRAKKSRRNKAERASISPAKFISRKLKLTLTSLVFSLIIFAGSWLGYKYFFLDAGFFESFFFILALISGFLALAFFIALLVFLVLKAFRK